MFRVASPRHRALLLAAITTAACGDDGGGEGGSTAAGTSSGDATSSSSGDATTVALVGAVEKGPFILGSSVTVSVLGADLAPTGQTFETETTSDLGEFTVPGLPLGPLALEGSGFYYDEIAGDLSEAELTLRALVVPGDGGAASAFVNLVTHLTKQRVEALVGEGESFAAAVSQAESELQQALAITTPGFQAGASGVEMTLAGGDSDANAYLFAVSSVLVQVAHQAASGSVAARLQELLNTMASDLASGEVRASTRASIRDALLQLHVNRVAAGFAARMEELGLPPDVPDMHRVLDQDGDGLANLDDNCQLDPNDDQEDADADGRGDACDRCPELDCATDCIPAGESATGADVCAPLCETSEDCLFGETCSALEGGELGEVSICAPGCDPGGDDCADGFVCVDEGGEGVCIPRGTKDDGDICHGPLECAEGLVCMRAWALPEPYATDEACRRPCETGADCPSGQCIPENGFCRLGGGELGDACEPGVPGTCAEGGCGVGVACDGSFCCQPVGGVGEACFVDNQGFQRLACDSDLACGANPTICPEREPPVTGKNVCCIPTGDVGEPCTIIPPDRQNGEEYVCNPGGLCVVGAHCDAIGAPCCIPAGGEQEPCMPGYVCDDGLTCTPDEVVCTEWTPCCAPV